LVSIGLRRLPAGGFCCLFLRSGAMFGIGTTELMVIMVVAVVLFGHKLPSRMRSIGQSLNAFKAGLHEPVAEVNSDE
jgi:TatA/E family protein of Tat protein translocase